MKALFISRVYLDISELSAGTPLSRLSKSDGSMRHPPRHLAANLFFRPFGMLDSEVGVDHPPRRSPHPERDREPFGLRLLAEDRDHCVVHSIFVDSCHLRLLMPIASPPSRRSC